MKFMKRLFLSVATVLFAVSLNAQLNQACYADTALIDEVVIRKDTSYMVKREYQKGDWNLYWDFALTKPKSEYHYTDKGEKTGTWKEFYKNGKLRAQWDYQTPVVSAFPPGKEWYPSGTVKTERTQTADTVYETQYYSTGKISSYNKWDSKGMWIQHIEYCDNGQVMINYYPTAPSPLPVKKFYCNGQLKAEYNWYAFGYTGIYKEYHDNGKIAVQGQYTEKPSDQIAFMARKTGTWIYYDQSGKVTKKEKWENGKLVLTEK
jgi:antitoxin component YwqK of YwqJK toxin-antitoxin module